jgi:hypothetical protein
MRLPGDRHETAPMSDEAQARVGKRLDDVAKILAGALVAVAGIMTALGLTSDIDGPSPRDCPVGHVRSHRRIAVPMSSRWFWWKRMLWSAVADWTLIGTVTFSELRSVNGP